MMVHILSNLKSVNTHDQVKVQVYVAKIGKTINDTLSNKVNETFN